MNWTCHVAAVTTVIVGVILGSHWHYTTFHPRCGVGINDPKNEVNSNYSGLWEALTLIDPKIRMYGNLSQLKIHPVEVVDPTTISESDSGILHPDGDATDVKYINRCKGQVPLRLHFVP